MQFKTAITSYEMPRSVIKCQFIYLLHGYELRKV